MDCLIPLIGLSQNECPCLGNENRPPDFNKSLSGFYLDDMEDGVPLQYPQGAAGCGDNGVWSLLVKARKEGLNEFLTDFGVAIERAHTTPFTRFNGLFGEPKSNTPLYGLSKEFAGFQFIPKENGVKGAQMVIRAFTMYMATAINPNKTLQIWKASVPNTEGLFDAEKVYEINVTVVANQKVRVELSTPLILDLTDSVGNPVRYLYVYERGGDTAMNIKFSCGCGGPRLRIYEQYGELYGIEADSLSEIDNISATGSSFSNGLSVEVELRCNTTSWLCQLTNGSITNYGQVFAKTFQLYAINKLIGFILSSNAINKYTLMKQEALYGKRNANRTRINERFNFLRSDFPFEYSDCMKCGDRSNMVVATIYV